ncbi:hypothetical protein [Flavobacterium sp.]|uniref:hypothetical protein n=1 Tax=Flavobacterium sp. TaxID=239 RepID=UPI00375267F3
MENLQYESRKISNPESNAIVIHHNKGINEVVLYVKPYDLEPTKMTELVDIILKFLNNPKPL